MDNPSRCAAPMIDERLAAPSHALDSTSSCLDGSTGGSRFLIFAQRKGGLPHVVPGLGICTLTPASINKSQLDSSVNVGAG